VSEMRLALRREIAQRTRQVGSELKVQRIRSFAMAGAEPLTSSVSQAGDRWHMMGFIQRDAERRLTPRSTRDVPRRAAARALARTLDRISQ